MPKRNMTCSIHCLFLLSSCHIRNFTETTLSFIAISFPPSCCCFKALWLVRNLPQRGLMDGCVWSHSVLASKLLTWIMWVSILFFSLDFQQRASGSNAFSFFFLSQTKLSCKAARFKPTDNERKSKRRRTGYWILGKATLLCRDSENDHVQWIHSNAPLNQHRGESSNEVSSQCSGKLKGHCHPGGTPDFK